MAMLVARERDTQKINSKPNHTYRADNSIIKSQLFLFLFFVCVCTIFSPVQRTVTLLLYSKCLVYIITKKTHPKPTKNFFLPSLTIHKCIYKIFLFPYSCPFPLSPPDTFQSVQGLFKKKKRRRKMVKLVKYLFVLPPLPPPDLSTSLQVYGNTLNHKN